MQWMPTTRTLMPGMRSDLGDPRTRAATSGWSEDVLSHGRLTSSATIGRRPQPPALTGTSRSADGTHIGPLRARRARIEETAAWRLLGTRGRLSHSGAYSAA